MTEEKKSPFTVSDKRKFTLEGELRPDAPPSSDVPEPPSPVAEEQRPNVIEMPRAATPEPEEVVEGPTAEEKKASTDAYNASAKEIDERLERELKQHGGGRKLADFEMTFEKFVASIYMTALMQLGLVAEQGGQPRADIIGARQTIDTLALLADKTRGNLTDREDVMLQNCLYECRMAYIEVTNAIARASQPGMPTDPSAGLK